MYNTTEQIKAAFIKAGWGSDTEFEELTTMEAEKIGSYSILCDMKQGKKFFRMLGSGNVFNSRGEVVLYNIPAAVKQN